ncbi:MAG: hypothetical protein P4L66_04400 [Acetobacteraceae bacterium]|nr:hypothetical protein [Acetobacteraceae bacterium]
MIRYNRRMLRHLPLLRLWRGLLAMLVVVGLSTAMPMAQAAPIGWLAGAICHADSGTNAPDQDPAKAPICPHCIFCHAVAAVVLPPGPDAVPTPRLFGQAEPILAPVAMPAPLRVAAYASRGPPELG